MELVDGKDLDALMSSGLLPFPVVIFVIAEVLRGLGYAHDLPAGPWGAVRPPEPPVRGIVHRDVSPHNVLLSWEGSVKVSDFGIAKARAASEATASVFIKGKPAYMSPEQANGQPLDGRSDLFAVGIMLWEMLTGRRLFVGEDTRATLAAVLFGQIPRPRSVRGDIPKDVERVTMKLLERELPARYATGEDALADLLECSDAPKRGREALSELLAERFPMEARVRGSRARGGRGGAQPPENMPPSASPSYSLPTAPTITPHGSSPVAAVMNAPTGTLPPIARPRRGRGMKLVLVALVIAVSGAATFAIVSLANRAPETPGSASGNVGSGTATIAAKPPPPVVDAAAQAPPPPPPPPADAAEPPETSKKDARSAQQGHAAKYGQLKVSAFPVVEVIVDGTNYGETPKTIKLTAGKHTVRLRNKDQGIDEPHSVQITENTVTPLDRIK